MSEQLEATKEKEIADAGGEKETAVEPQAQSETESVGDDAASQDDQENVVATTTAGSEPEAASTEEQGGDEQVVEAQAGTDAEEDNTASEAETEDVSAEASTPEASTPEASAVESTSADVEATPADEPSGDDEGEQSNEDAPATPALDPETLAELKAQEDVEVEVEEDGTTRVVRILAEGQQVEGVVKRITDFGAFVDIGVGRDGLIHISELSVNRVGKVTDVLSEGQAVEPWIKKLDRKRNRISLTLIDPETKTIRDLEKGEIVQGKVTRILPYGAFIDIGIGRDALLHVREMGEGYVAKPEDVVSVGETLEARVIDLSRRRSRVDLSLKGLRAEPEAEVTTGPNVSDEEPAEDIEVLSPMELAFKKAMEAEGMEAEDEDEDKRKGKRRKKGSSIQDDIIARTLDTGRK